MGFTHADSRGARTRATNRFRKTRPAGYLNWAVIVFGVDPTTMRASLVEDIFNQLRLVDDVMKESE